MKQNLPFSIRFHLARNIMKYKSRERRHSYDHVEYRNSQVCGQTLIKKIFCVFCVKNLNCAVETQGANHRTDCTEFRKYLVHTSGHWVYELVRRTEFSKNAMSCGDITQSLEKMQGFNFTIVKRKCNAGEYVLCG